MDSKTFLTTTQFVFKLPQNNTSIAHPLCLGIKPPSFLGIGREGVWIAETQTTPYHYSESC